MTNERVPFPSSAFSALAQAEVGHWWFRSRNRLLLWVLGHKVGSVHRWLEVGCGTGYVLEGVSLAFPAMELYGSEYYEEGLAFARARVPTAHFEQMDATSLIRCRAI